MEDKDYSLQYDRANLSPQLWRDIQALYQTYQEQYGHFPCDSGDPSNVAFWENIKNEIEQKKEELYDQWKWAQRSALLHAKADLDSRLREEDIHAFHLQGEEQLKKLEAKDEQTQWKRDEEETRRIHERQRKERERQEKLEEQQRKEQEKIDERIEQLRDRPIPEEQRFSGTWICSPQGRGKTTLLLSMLQKDLLREDRPAIIIIDGKGDIINLVIDLVPVLRGWRCIILDPRNPIALNPLSISNINIHKAISRIEYIFSALLDAKITPKQQSLFRSIIHALILGFENPTSTTFRDIISNGVGKYQQQIAKLPADMQEFFAKEFERDYDATRQELKWRLRLLDHQPFFKNIFNAPCSNVNLEKECDEGKIIVVNNNQDLFGAEAAEFLGRFFLAQIWNVSTSRSRRTGYKRPIYVYLDEAQMVIRRDEMVANIIDECRSQNIAMLFSHQRCEQIKEPNVLSALSNCAIRISNADEEAKIMAEKLHTDQDHLLSLKRGQFAVYVRDLVRNAFTMNVTPADWSGWERLGPEKRRLINAYMRAKYGYVRTKPEQAKTTELETHKPSERQIVQKQKSSVQIPSVEKTAPKKDPSAPAPWGKV